MFHRFEKKYGAGSYLLAHGVLELRVLCYGAILGMVRWVAFLVI